MGVVNEPVKDGVGKHCVTDGAVPVINRKLASHDRESERHGGRRGPPADRADAQAAIQEYIESFYNRQRRHSRLGNVPPALFAENFSKQPQAA